MKLGGVEADDSGERLAVGEAAVGRHEPLGVPGGDFDMIAEDRVVADLERADAGGVAVARLERGYGAATIGSRVAQRVETLVIGLGDIAALRRIDGRRSD